MVILALTYASLVVGELAPKAIALRNPERLACFMAPVIAAISRISAPLVRLLRASTDLVLRVLGMGTPAESPFVSEEDVRYLVREGARKGIFEKTEEELVHNVFEFADTTVREVMVPRPSIQGIDVGTPADQVPRLVAAIGHSRVLAYRGDVALRQFQQHREHLGLVVDEYGAVVGLITVEDIVERIVGDIGERDHDSLSLRRLPDGALIVDGLTAIDDIRAAGVVVEDSLDYTTAAGFVNTALDAIPTVGSSVTSAGYRWTVLEVDGPRARTIRIEAAAAT